jgi:hypothetical protein
VPGVRSPMRHASRCPRHPSAGGHGIPIRSVSNRPAMRGPPTVRPGPAMTAARRTGIARPGHDLARPSAEAASPLGRVLSPPAPGLPSQPRPLARMRKRAAGTPCLTWTTGLSSPPTSRRSVLGRQGQPPQFLRLRVRMARRAAAARPSQQAGPLPPADLRSAATRDPCQLGRCLRGLSPLARCQCGHGRSPLALRAARPPGAPRTSARRNSLMYERRGQPATAASRPLKAWLRWHACRARSRRRRRDRLPVHVPAVARGPHQARDRQTASGRVRDQRQHRHRTLRPRTTPSQLGTPGPPCPWTTIR